MRQMRLILVVSLVVLGALFVAQGTSYLMAQEPEVDPIGEPPTFLAEYYDAWVNSPHARFEDEAFTHWDEDGEVPDRCAKCHSAGGYLDFLGADGSEAGVVDSAHELGTVVNCDVCHNSATDVLTSITFPSGETITDLDDSSRCMACHQGRSSTDSVVAAIEELGLTDSPNTTNEELGFINIHYYAAAASIYGSEVRGGFQYADQTYIARFEHVEGLNTCASCHDPHTLELQVETCTECHTDVESVEDLRNIRSVGSSADFDGDGDLEEGIYGEIETLKSILYETIQMYAADVAGESIIWANAYPYWFIDTNGDGEAGDDEAIFPNSYKSFTPALLKATYNYQVAKKDPGGYAHNADYHIQLMYDSITDLMTQMGADGPEGVERNGFAHFASSDDAFRHWDEDGEVPGRCSKCHTAEGLPFFLENGVTIGFEPSNSLTCTTCHADATLNEPAVYPVTNVVFPSGAELAFGEESASNICLSCHQGRESGVSIVNAIERAGVGNDEVSEALRFVNPHYYASGATIFGTQANGAYEFPDMDYNGLFNHTRRLDECADCHEPHSAEVRVTECADCHEELEEEGASPRLIRAHPDDKDRIDYDGDGNSDEPIRDEIKDMEDTLFALISDYAANTIGTPIGYGSGYPYWFNDTNGNGEVDPDEQSRDNSYASWTPTLLRAVYNWQYVHADPGSFVHNPDYIIQVLYDSIQAIGGDEAVANYTRPEVREIEEDD